MTDWLVQASPSELESFKLTIWGVLTLVLSLGFVTSLASWCLYKVFREDPSKVHGAVEAGTYDQSHEDPV